MLLIGSSFSSGSISNSIRKLKKEGSAAETPTSTTLRLTEKGNAEVGHIGLPSNKENLADIQDRLTGKAKALFDILSDGRTHSRQELVSELGSMAKGGKDNTLRQIRQLPETEESKNSNGTTMYHLRDIAFPEGRPNNE